MRDDRYGLPLSSPSDRAVAAYREGVDHILCATPGADRAFTEALAADPGFALAAAGLARTQQIHGRIPEAKAAIAQARALAGGVSRRERQHVEAIGLLLDGNAPGALAAVRAHTAEFPRDALVLSLAVGAFGLIAFSGRLDHDALLLELLDGLAPHYAGDWWFPFAHGWAHNEARRHPEARRLMEQARTASPISPTKRATSRGARATSKAGFPRTSGRPRCTATSPGIWPSSSWGGGRRTPRFASTRTASRRAPRWRRRSTRFPTPPPFSGGSVSMAKQGPRSGGPRCATSPGRLSRARALRLPTSTAR